MDSPPVPTGGVKGSGATVPSTASPSPLFSKMQRLFNLDKTLTLKQLESNPDPSVKKLAGVLADKSGNTKMSRAEFAKALAVLNINFTIKGADGLFGNTPAADSNNFLNFFFQNNDISSKGFDQALRDIDLTYKIYGGEQSERSVLKDFHHKGSFRAVNANKQGKNLENALNLGTKPLKEYISEVHQKDPNSVLSNAYLRLNPRGQGDDPSWDDLATLMLLIGKKNYEEELRVRKDTDKSTKSKKIDQAMSSIDEQGLKDVIQELAKGNSGREKFDDLNQRVTLTDENKSSFFSFLSSPFTSKPEPKPQE